MKLLYILIFSFLFHASYAQGPLTVGQYYEFTDAFTIYEAIKKPKAGAASLTMNDIKTDDTFQLNGNTATVKEKWVFKVYTIQDELTIITIANEDSAVEGKYFVLTSLQKQQYTQSLRGDIQDIGFVSSAITIPIKIRFGDGSDGTDIMDENGNRRRFSDFEGNVNVGVAAGLRIKASKSGTDFFNFLGGISIGASKINSDTAEVATETNASILTPFLGVLYEYNDFELGIFYGWDHISGSVGRTWVYQGKPWLGVGLGYKVFATQESSTVAAQKLEKMEKKAKKQQEKAQKKS